MVHSTKNWLLYLVLARSCTLAHFRSFWKSFRHATFKIYLAQRSQSRLFCSRQNATRSNLFPFLSFHFLLLLYSFLFLFTTFESFFSFLFIFHFVSFLLFWVPCSSKYRSYISGIFRKLTPFQQNEFQSIRVPQSQTALSTFQC